MSTKKKSLKRKLVHAAGWQVAKRAAKMMPFGGTIIAVGDIKRKGAVRGVLNSGLDALPVVGLVKNGIELFTGDLIPDKENKNGKT